MKTREKKANRKRPARAGARKRAAPTKAAGANVQLLRHTVATRAYRAGNAVRGAPGAFAGF